MRTFVKMILPVAAFMLASAGAVSTHNSENSVKGHAAMTGYLHTPSDPCAPISVDCQVQATALVCTAFGQNVYREDAPDICTEVLWKVPQ